MVELDVVQEDWMTRLEHPTLPMATEHHFIHFSEMVVRTEYKMFSEKGPAFLITMTDHKMETAQVRKGLTSRLCDPGPQFSACLY